MQAGPKKIPAWVQFESAADEITQRFVDAAVISSSPYAGRWGTFRRESYSLIRKIKARGGGHQVIKAVVRRRNCIPSRLSYEGNEFHWGLLAIDPTGDVIDSKRLSLLSRQLAYADRHGVPEHFLIGFLYQSGASASISRKLKANTREPWFRH